MRCGSLIQVPPEEHLFLLKLNYLAGTLATIYATFVNKQRKPSQDCLYNTILILSLTVIRTCIKQQVIPQGNILQSIFTYVLEVAYVCFSLELSSLLIE